MSSRADYLSKYISSSAKSNSKKKKKKIRESNVHVLNTGIVNDTESYDNVDEPEDDPIEVSTGGFREFKGFKRIDNKEIASTDPNSKSADEVNNDTKQGETVYRDLTGRIIDIEERRKELAIEKQKNEVRAKEAELINISDITKLEEKKLEEDLSNIKTFRVSKYDQEYNQLMKSKSRFDDPLSSFENSNTSNIHISKTGRYHYNKGVSIKNRFNIKSGYFWDGIDRSNGFEDLLLQKRQELMYNKIRDRHNVTYDEIDVDSD